MFSGFFYSFLMITAPAAVVCENATQKCNFGCVGKGVTVIGKTFEMQKFLLKTTSIVGVGYHVVMQMINHCEIEAEMERLIEYLDKKGETDYYLRLIVEHMPSLL